MSEAKELKTVNITLNYRSSQDLRESFKLIQNKLINGFKKDKGTVKGNMFDFYVLNSAKKFDPVRLEDFGNGLSEVYESKINKI